MDEGQIEKIDLDKVDWRGSREFFESLGEALDKLDDKDEAYDFTWVGKRRAIIEAGAPINKTFRPDGANSKNWDTTENLFIEGDNLDALKLLQESYLGKVKMIYIDPPYNTGKDFVYHDNFKASTEQYDEDTEYKDESGNIQFKKNEKTNGRYHSDWLSMMYPRLKLARNLLADDGVIFISIDDNEQANLKKLCDEIYGEDNFIATIAVNRTSEIATENTIQKHEYIITYCRQVDNFKVKGTPKYSISRGTVGNANQTQPEIEFPAGLPIYNLSDGVYKETRKIPGSSENIENFGDIVVADGKLAAPVTLKARWRSSNDMRNFFANSCRPTPAKINGVIEEIYFENDRFNPQIKKATFEKIPDLYLENSRGSKDLESFDLSGMFDNPKSVKLIRNFVGIVTIPGDIVLDFFSGSATTAHATMQLNAEDGGSRKWIMIQLPEETDEKSEAFKAGYKTIPEISRERIRRAGDKIASEHPEAKVDYGFRSLVIDDTNYKEVYKSVGKYEQSTLLGSVDNVKEDRSDLDLLFGVLTQSALELNRPLETRDISGAKTFLYDYFGEVSGLVACFDESISEEAVKAIAGLKPLTAVFRDSSFADSQAKVNLAEHFRIISPETKVKVI